MLKSPKVLHLEVTDVCQAACPQCERETNIAFNNNVKNNLTVDQIKNLFSEEFIKNLDKMFMCGNYGDPAAGKHTLEIFRYFKQVNPNITVGMNTNGAINNVDWWNELASIFTSLYDYVVFSIDGLEDTNHVYRKNVVWNKLINNVKSFISAGGMAQWEMLIFEHNKHQLIDAERLAKELGFAWFRSKVSKRFTTHPISFLSPPVGFSLPNTLTNRIECHAINENSVYVSATGKVLPCCWFGAEVYDLDPHATRLLEDWQVLEDSLISDPHRICKNTCSADTDGSSFSKQWQIQKQLR
jgi:hypothetical protein